VGKVPDGGVVGDGSDEVERHLANIESETIM